MSDNTNPGKPDIAKTYDVTQAVSINTYVPVTINGEYFKIQLTTRHSVKAEQIVADFENHIAALVEIRKAHTMTKATAPADDNMPPTPLEPEYIADQQEASTPVPANGNMGTFKAGKVTATVTDGKVYFKIAAADGERFPKFPVMCWQEVFEHAGIDWHKFNALDATTMPVLSGWTAEYEKNEKGNPRKVTRLFKA